MAKKTDKSISFEEQYSKLEEIVSRMEGGPTLEEAFALYQEGSKIAARLDARLSEMERKVFEVKNMGRLTESEDPEPELGLFETGGE